MECLLIYKIEICCRTESKRDFEIKWMLGCMPVYCRSMTIENFNKRDGKKKQFSSNRMSSENEEFLHSK